MSSPRGQRWRRALRGALDRGRSLPTGTWARCGAFALFFAVALVLVLALGVPSVSEAREYVDGLGAIGPLVFVLSFGVLTLTPFPKSILAVVAGALWGLGLGLALSLSGVLIGASLAFYVGQLLIADAVRGLVGTSMEVVDEAARKSTFLAVLAVRIIPVLPFTAMNFAFGVTTVRFWVFFAATGVGSILGTGAYVAVGAFGHDVTSWQFWAALGAVGSLTLVGLYVARRRMVRTSNRPAEATRKDDA